MSKQTDPPAEEAAALQASRTPPFKIKDVNCNFLLQGFPDPPPRGRGDPRTEKPTETARRLVSGKGRRAKAKPPRVVPGIVVGYYSTAVPRITNPVDYAEYESANRMSFEMFNFVYKVWTPCVKAELDVSDFEEKNKKQFDKKVAAMADVTVSMGVNEVQGAIPPGTLVDVRFSNRFTLKNPQIVRVRNKLFNISSMFPDPPGRSFVLGTPSGVAGTLGAAGVGAEGPPSSPGLPPATDKQVPSARGILPNGSPQGAYSGDSGGSPPYILPLAVARMQSNRMYLNNTKNPVTGKAERHQAVDHGAASGTPILAIADGVVTFTKSGSEEAGNYIVTQHTDVINGGDLWVRQLHMVKPTTLRRGDRVSRGQVIGYVGSTGRSTGPHVHFEIGKTGPTTAKWRSVGNKINPIGYYPDNWFVTHDGKAYIFPDRMGGTPSV
jgi:murein DD-endopeptidase MepM/ murein hydrolase activator NlpD